MWSAAKRVPVCPLWAWGGGAHAACAHTCSHRQVRVLHSARGGYYSLLVFLSI